MHVKFRKGSLERVWFKILAATVYRRVLLLERTLGHSIPVIIPHLDVTIDCLDKTHMAEYLQLQSRAQPSLIEDRLNKGHTCFAARYQDRLIAVAWATPQRIDMSPYVPLARPLSNNNIYFYESFTEPSLRGLSIQAVLCTHMMRYFAAKGFQRALAGVVPENTSSLRKLQKCGFQPYEMIRFVRLGPCRRLLPSIPYLHDR